MQAIPISDIDTSMSAQLIYGKPLSNSIREQLRSRIAKLPRPPGLAVILVGNDPASDIYVSKKIKACPEVGIISHEHRLPEETTQTEVLDLIAQLNANSDVDGILLQLPLPAHIDANTCLNAIDPEKDVDGLHPQNVGKLVARQEGIIPCTPLGCLLLIKSIREDLTGLNAVVVGASLLFGKPMAQLLLRENCTVTQTHRHTQDLASFCRNADILCVAVGKDSLIGAEHIKEGAIVIDVGVNRRADGKVVGDVDFEAVFPKAGAITPVPGGVGPMTITCLLQNTVDIAEKKFNQN